MTLDLNQTYFFQTSSQVLRIVGEKAAGFLHGQLTNSIKDLKAGQGNYNLLLTNKGKVLADCFVLNRGTFIDILADEVFSEKLSEHLNRLAPLSRCTVSVVPVLSVFHVVGKMPEPWPALEKFHGQEFSYQGNPWILFRSDRLGDFGYDVILESETARNLEEFLKNATRLSPRQIEDTRIKNGVAKLGVDVTDANLPQEGRLDHALHFSKGCYLGQEVVARLHFRGHVNKLLTPFRLDGHAVTVGEKVFHDGQEVGSVTSSAFDQDQNVSYVLAYVPYKLVSEDKEFFVASRKLIKL